MGSADGRNSQAQLHCNWEIRTDQGPRSENQDRAVAISQDNRAQIQRKGVLIIVCDGVGGMQGGQRAADVGSLAALTAYYDDDSGNNPQQALRYAIEQANNAVHTEATKTPGAPNMATTIVMAAVVGSQLYVANVGDSRAYLYQNGKLEQLSTDHSWVAEQVRLGALTKEEARHSTMRNLITRSLGGSANNTPEFVQRDFLPGSRVLLCSDGVHGAIADDDIAAILAKYPKTGAAANAILHQALANKTQDNATVALLDCGPKKGKGFPLLPVLAVLIVLLILFVGSALLLMSGGNTHQQGVKATVPVQTSPTIKSTASLREVVSPALNEVVTATPVALPTASQASIQTAATSTLAAPPPTVPAPLLASPVLTSSQRITATP